MKATTASDRFLLTEAARPLCAFLLPPLSVFLTVGLTGQFWLNIVLTLLGYLPGMVHAIGLLPRPRTPSRGFRGHRWSADLRTACGGRRFPPARAGKW